MSIADEILKKRKYSGKKSYKEFLRNPLGSTFVLTECDPREVALLLKSLNPIIVGLFGYARWLGR